MPLLAGSLLASSNFLNKAVGLFVASHDNNRSKSGLTPSSFCPLTQRG